jgi:hypothetical protein
LPPKTGRGEIQHQLLGVQRGLGVAESHFRLNYPRTPNACWREKSYVTCGKHAFWTNHEVLAWGSGYWDVKHRLRGSQNQRIGR